MPAPYFSEIKYLGSASVDFIEITVDAGTDVSGLQVIVYHADGTVRSTNSLGSVVNTIAGKDVYIIDTATSGSFNGLHKFGAVALNDGGTVTGFFSFEGSVTATQGPASGTSSTVLGAPGRETPLNRPMAVPSPYKPPRMRARFRVL